MANFVPSALLAGQAKFNERFTKGEWRLPDCAALNAMAKAEIANPAIKEMRTREDRAVYAYFPVRQAAIGSTARAAAHTGAAGDSLANTLTWSTYAEPFSISIKQADNNVFSMAEMYASSLNNAVLNLLSRLDPALVALMVADRTQYNAGGGNGSVNAADDIYEIPLAEANYFFQNVKDTMWYNMWRGQIMGIVDSKAFSAQQRLATYGPANAQNLSFQLAGVDVIGTTRSILGSGYNGSGLFWENGLVDILTWIPKQNRKALDPDKAMTYNGDYGQFSVPQFPGVDFAIHAYATRADNTANGGYTQDLVMQFEVSLDMGYKSAPLSSFRGANDSVVYGVGQLNA